MKKEDIIDQSVPLSKDKMRQTLSEDHEEECGNSHHHEKETGTGKKKQKEERSLINILKLPTFLHSKTGLCKHKFGCIENTVKGMYRMFWVTLAFKTALNHIFLIFKPSKLIKSL